jgi:hypothetical protein
VLRREGDSNPRFAGRRTTVFETAAFDHSAISPIFKATFTRELSHGAIISLLFSDIRRTKIRNI